MALFKPTDHELGVHFGLSEEAYHADIGLGSTDIKMLFRNPANYWAGSHMNPLRAPQSSTPYQKFGSAVHKLVLEGQEAFESSYCCKPILPEGCLITLEDLKGKARELGVAVSGTKAEIADRIAAIDKKIPIEAHIMDRFNKTRGNREMLSEDDYVRASMAGRMIRANRHLAHVFEGGFPEVSIFWKQKGVKCKARLDYLKPGVVADLKSMSNWMDMNFREAWTRAIRNYRYDMQAAHYLNGRFAANQFFAEGDVFVHNGNAPDGAMIEQLADELVTDWLWIVYQSDMAPISHGYLLNVQDILYENAVNDVATAIDNYRSYFAKFGESMWVYEAPIETITADDMPMWWTGSN